MGVTIHFLFLQATIAHQYIDLYPCMTDEKDMEFHNSQNELSRHMIATNMFVTKGCSGHTVT